MYHTISLPPSLTCSLQDFTDSAYTSHDHRQNIILLSERARLEMAGLVRLPGVSVSCDWLVWGHVTGWSPLIGCRCPASPATWTPGTSASSTTPPATAGTGPSSLSGDNYYYYISGFGLWHYITQPYWLPRWYVLSRLWRHERAYALSVWIKFFLDFNNDGSQCRRG